MTDAIQPDDSRQIYARLGDVERDVAGIRASLDSLAEAVRRSNQPTNWVGIGSLVLAGMAFVFTINDRSVANLDAQIVGIESRQVIRAQILDQLIGNSASSEATIKEIDERVDRQQSLDELHRQLLDNTRQRTANLEGILTEVMRRLDAMDEYGSRRWIQPVE